MKSQFYASRAGSRSLVWGEPLRIAQLAGEFAVLGGRVWLTREGDPEDYVLDAGETFDITASDVVVVEPWCRGEPALIAWRPGRSARLPMAASPRETTDLGLRTCA
ncbi:hypothetical protein BURC_00688 [Burkholderiaceae bacterium]|nr:hypothetical protein BURC_00688 [Burkholderiaceae bacterium]